ncbi:hypothetical protein F7R01_05525 [Pseudomonas argentinensis]|uniref:Phospholipase_D-nuclease N-terminal n=1 Tax=Phytopseudomonas argentinensis TaxID=289370 RepID=A0A1I3KCJ9_9GAMM|nr:PLDc N-terminal domain-containing protein [Pseudomonas argentinensis]KAB0550675.1 hypothetical protein F7R01_05525 [Pseudomonas argentinensis]SFI70183.1 Phospholipase_D-nuclease N-terminal [Pseudomonas argentinensis]
MGDPSLLFWLGAFVVIAFVDLVTIMNLWRSEKSANTRLMWALIIILLPVVGLIIWGLVGPRGMPKPPTSPEQSK